MVVGVLYVHIDTQRTYYTLYHARAHAHIHSTYSHTHNAYTLSHIHNAYTYTINTLTHIHNASTLLHIHHAYTHAHTHKHTAHTLTYIHTYIHTYTHSHTLTHRCIFAPTFSVPIHILYTCSTCCLFGNATTSDPSCPLIDYPLQVEPSAGALLTCSMHSLGFGVS